MHFIIFDSFAFGAATGFLFGLAWELMTCRVLKLGKLSRLKGVHIHHSLFGPGAWLTLPKMFDFGSPIVIGIGLGVILQHALNEGFTFITKS